MPETVKSELFIKQACRIMIDETFLGKKKLEIVFITLNSYFSKIPDPAVLQKSLGKPVSGRFFEAYQAHPKRKLVSYMLKKVLFFLN
jgi:hypothetical protein